MSLVLERLVVGWESSRESAFEEVIAVTPAELLVEVAQAVLQVDGVGLRIEHLLRKKKITKC